MPWRFQHFSSDAIRSKLPLEIPASDAGQVGNPARRLVGPLAASSQMLRETIANVRIDVSKGPAWIPKVEVVLRASVLRRVGNTEACSQPVPKTTTYTFVPAIPGKLPLVL